MKRRAFISSVAMVGIAGCIGGSDEPKRLDEYTAGVQGPSQYLGYSAEVVQGTYADAGQPVTVEVTITNTSDEEVVYSDSRNAAFFASLSENNHGMYPSDLRSTSYSYNSQVDAWVLDSPYEQTSDVQIDRLDPGESRTERLYLFLLDSSDAGEKSPDTLEFEETIRAGTSQEERQENEYTVRLSLTLLK